MESSDEFEDKLEDKSSSEMLQPIASNFNQNGHVVEGHTQTTNANENGTTLSSDESEKGLLQKKGVRKKEKHTEVESNDQD